MGYIPAAIKVLKITRFQGQVELLYQLREAPEGKLRKRPPINSQLDAMMI
jgi:hypothetical protein